MAVVVAHRRGRLHRGQPSPRQRAADHWPVPAVNRDASRSFAGRDSGGRERHERAGREGSTDSAGQRRVAPRIGPDGRTPRRSRCGRDRICCKSPPGCGSVHRGTAAPEQSGVDRIGRATDDGRGNSCDTAPACVPRHDVAHGAEVNLAVRLGAVLAANGAVPAASAPALLIRHDRNPDPKPPICTDYAAAERELVARAPSWLQCSANFTPKNGTAPDSGGFRQPSTSGRGFARQSDVRRVAH